MAWWSRPYSSLWWGVLIGSFLLSAFVTWLSIRYAHHRNLIDLPGQRRSHNAPTPRGGGIGIVAAIMTLGCALVLLRWREASPLFLVSILLALLLVAVLGWVDDHRPLSIRLRLVVQFLAASMLWLLPMVWQSATLGWYATHVNDLIVCGLVTVFIVWSINLHNFMDGINGLLACQAVFVFVAFACATHAPTELLLVPAAATLGFLPFNFPLARVFMGDVGSYALGLLIPLAAFAVESGDEFDPTRSVLLTGAIASSAFVIDATCNLLSRVLRGRRWYSAHREHLYQWMTRTGMSHARVVAWYMGWNVVVVAPVLWLLNRLAWWGDSGENPAAPILRQVEIASTLAVYGLGVALWIFGKRWCLHKVQSLRHA
jgi:UDP-N-acetylmuramyl pentapeptide phosphotransferase/UDP-N-acetylglucosamine-1-phosphate transferase